MPSLKDAIAQNQARIAAGGVSGNRPISAPEQPLVAAATPVLDLPMGGGLPQRAAFPANTVLASDRSDSNRIYRGQGARSATFPFPSTPQQVSKTVVQQIVSSTPSTSVELETNGLANPLQSLLNLIAGTGITLSADSTGGVTINSTAAGDGLDHGVTPWEIDPSYVMWREDFLPSLNTAGNNTGTNSLTWTTVGQAANGGVLFSTGAPPNIGIITWTPNTTVGLQGPGTMLTPTPWSSGTGSWQSMPILDYPSWKATFVFKVEEAGVNTNAFNMTHKSLYVGFCGTMDHYNTIDLGQSTRPRTFYGVRYDTSPGQIAIGGSTIATSFQAGMVTYTITSNGTYAANGSYAGQMITVTGYTNPNNNGTFLCTGSTSSALLLHNPSAVTGSGAGFTGTMTTPAGPNDSSYTFECTNGIPVAAIASANYRNYLPELTFATGITPTKGRWVRLDITLTTAGQLTMTLVDGVSTASHTFAIQQQVVPLNLGANETSGQVGSITTFSDGWTQCALGNIAGSVNAAVTTFDAHTCGYCSVADTGGNMITFAGLTGSLSRMNGTWGPTFYNNSAQTLNFPTSLSALVAQTPNAGSTIAFYPSLTPFFGFGWDDSGNNAQINTASIYVDFFGFCWNPGINPTNALTPNSLKARYF